MSKAIIALDNMPVHCDQCPLWEYHDDWDEMVGRCIIEDGARSRTYGRPAWCPLVEVPPYRDQRHGDNGYDRAYTDGYNAALADLHVGYHPMSQ